MLLQSADGRNLLCDGGVARTMRDHVSPVLDDLIPSDKQLDCVYVSHVDHDHIDGVLRLLEDALALSLIHI